MKQVHIHVWNIYEATLWSFDEFHRYLPEPVSFMLSFKWDFWYLYYDLSSIEGKMLRTFTNGKCNISSSEPNMNQILIFNDVKDKDEFDKYLKKHFNDYTDQEIEEDPFLFWRFMS